MSNCSKTHRHPVSECDEVEGRHVKNCTCTYGMDLEDYHAHWDYDERCRELNRKEMFRILENASKQVARWPAWMRNDKTPNIHDRIRNATWDMSAEELERVAKYAEKLAKKK